MALTAELANTRSITLALNGGVVTPVVGVGPQGATGSTGATGATGPTGPTGAPGVGGWTASTAYTAGDVVAAPDGSRIVRNTTGTSRPAFDSTEQALWTTVSAKAGTLENTSLLASFAQLLDNASTSADGALTVQKLTKVDATSGARAMTIPDGTIKGQQAAAEKTDSSTNSVTITGNIRLVGAGSIALAYQYETILFVWGGTFWEPLVGHRTKSSLDTQVDDRLAASPSVVAAAASAASSAVATSLATAGVLNAAAAPTLDTTRVLDPQVKTSGGSASGVQMPVTRITSGLPTLNGVAMGYGIETNRASTLSATIGQVYYGSATNTDPLRIPVTPAEVITVAAYLWTDQASARARMDAVFYDSSGVVVGSVLTGTYANIAASTWEQRVATFTVPALAAYVTPRSSIATLSGNTVTGAKTRLTAGLVVTGTVASPTYVDGTMNTLGWYWSGTAHASAAKKVQYLASEAETQVGSAAKVAAHAAAADPHTVYFKKVTAPTLATNRAIDPQLAATGASASAPSYTLSRITTGLPTGVSFGLKTVRAGTLNTTIAQMYLAPATAGQADPLRIAVTPAEVISLSAQMWTDQANSRARLDLFFFDSSGVLLASGGTVTGTYADIAASAWETRSQINVTVPALAAYVTPQATLGSKSGNTVTGAEARATAVTVVTGTALPAYADGTFEGWDWTGTAHASTSVKKFSTAAQSNVQAGGLTLTKTGSTLALARAFGTSGTLVQNLTLTGSNNGGFNIVSTTLNGVTVHANSDDICPIRTQLGTVGANHGYSGCVAAFTNPDGKTTADLGSEWQDTAGRHYVLLAIIGGLLIIGGDYTSPGSVTTSADVNPITNLTHVSGATHTGAIAFGTRTATELLPVTQRISVSLLADRTPITADGTYNAHEVVVHESYAILDYASIYDTAKANVGVSYTTLTVATAVRVSNAYRWTMGGCRVTQSLTELKPTTLNQCGGVQAFSLAETAGTLTRYLPGVSNGHLSSDNTLSTLTGHNWGAGIAMAAYAADEQILTSDLLTATRPAALALDVLDNSGTVLIGFAVGYLPYGARGDEASINATRLTKAPTKLWDLRGTKKLYPTFTMGETAGWGHLTTECFRAYLDPTQVAAVLASKGDAASAWEALDAQADLTRAA